MHSRKLTMYDVIGVGFMSALVFVASQISIPIPTILGITRIHLGNAFCLLSGFLLGGLRGGLAAGIGSMLFDLVNPAYVSDAPITFFNKFMMGLVCGSISFTRKGTGFNLLRSIIAGVLGALTYVLLYLTKTFIFDVYFLDAAVATAMIDVLAKARASLINAAIAVIISVPAYAAVLRTLSNTLLFRKIRSL